jgi:phosphatidylglycerophosphatase A
MSKLIATFFLVGYMKPASGTWGSAAALPVAWLIFIVGGWPLLALGAVAAFVAGWWATADHIAGGDDHDPSEVVIDEVAGQWIALLPVAIGATHAGVSFLALWPGILTAFFAFRLFDIWKPGPIGWADRRGDALGVMLDDVLAGIAAAIVVGIAAWAFHGF